MPAPKPRSSEFKRAGRYAECPLLSASPSWLMILARVDYSALIDMPRRYLHKGGPSKKLLGTMFIMYAPCPPPPDVPAKQKLRAQVYVGIWGGGHGAYMSLSMPQKELALMAVPFDPLTWHLAGGLLRRKLTLQGAPFYRCNAWGGGYPKRRLVYTYYG